MNWLKARLQALSRPNHLLQKKELQRLQASLQSYQDTVARKNKVIEELSNINEKRLTLEDLQLKPNEQVILKSCDAAFRHALYKSGEHVCLTTVPECCRKTAVKIREYQRTLTLSPKNKVPAIDDTSFDLANERSKKFFNART